MVVRVQIVVDQQGNVYGCWPANKPAVILWSNLPATAQLRSQNYQRQYKEWVATVSEPVAKSGKAAGQDRNVSLTPPGADMRPIPPFC